ncbi:MAG: glutathione S-transferase [Gammaproteobacteria bacterium]|nr:glutathione S-transferase [Gammaproteobacteria bacterium]
MITVHHLENSRSQRILWLLEELAVDYEVRRYERDKATKLAPPELQDVHPLGKSPVITDGNLTIAESGAIVEYLVNKYDAGRLGPGPTERDKVDYSFWLHYAEGSVMPLMLLSLFVGRIESAKMPFFVRPVARGIAGKIRTAYLDENVARHLGFMNEVLSDSEWFCGETLTAADIQMSFPIEAAEVRTNLAQSYPHLDRFLQRARALPTYQTALVKGGPYQLMGAAD